jgi:hypothetical protein
MNKHTKKNNPVIKEVIFLHQAMLKASAIEKLTKQFGKKR